MTMKGRTNPGVGTQGRVLEQFDDALSPAKGASLWQSCPLGAIRHDPSVGAIFFDDFHTLTKAADAWIATQATSGTATAGILAGGTLALAAGATTNHQGEQVQAAGVDFLPAANKHIWFEARFKVNVLTTELLLGLSEIDTGLITTGAVHTTNFIGFSSVTGDGVMLPNCISASTATNGAASNTLVVATYVKMGFVVNGLTSVTPYINGVAGTPITTNIPIVALTPSFVCQANGTGTPQMDLDYVMVAQLR